MKRSDSTNDDALRGFFHAAAAGDSNALSEALWDVPSMGLVRTEKGATGLMIAATHGHVQALRTLMPHSNIMATDQQGESALMRAAGGGHIACIEALCARLSLADWRVRNARGESAADRAASAGYERLAHQLNRQAMKSWDWETPTGSDGKNPLMFAAELGDLEAVHDALSELFFGGSGGPSG